MLLYLIFFFWKRISGKCGCFKARCETKARLDPDFRIYYHDSINFIIYLFFIYLLIFAFNYLFCTLYSKLYWFECQVLCSMETIREGIFALFLILKEHFIFLLLIIMLAQGVLHITFIIVKKFYSIPSLLNVF